MRHVLVIAGNHDLGLEWTKYYLAQGDLVSATYRNMEASEELLTIRNDRLTTYPCDVTKDNEIAALAEFVKEPQIIIYNAGIKGYKKRFIKARDNTLQELQLAMDVNCYGADRVLRAFMPQLEETPNSLFVYMSTGVSSTMKNASGGYYPYRVSKQAGNAVVRGLDIGMAEEWIKKGKPIEERPIAFALVPGLIDIGMGRGVQGAMPVEVAMPNMVKVIEYVRQSGDSHGLWTHKMEKMEVYDIPTVILDFQKRVESANETQPKVESTAEILSRLESAGEIPTKVASAETQPKLVLNAFQNRIRKIEIPAAETDLAIEQQKSTTLKV